MDSSDQHSAILKMRPRRPFGVSLAIFASVFLFAGVPLLRVFFFLSLPRLTFSEEDGIITGMSSPVSDVALFVDLMSGLIFIVVAVFAWHGRPSFVRLLLMLMTAGLSLFNILQGYLPALLTVPDPLEMGIDSLFETGRSLQLLLLVVTALVALYVVWYMNRWAARAFYRGFYLPEDIVTMQELDLIPRTPAEGPDSEA